MKNVINKILILLVVFVAIIGIYLFIGRDKKETESIIMGKPTLPTVTLLASSGENADNSIEINELFGYTNQMETKYMRDSITPISSGRTMTVKVKKYDNVVMGAEFEVRSMDCERLIEKTEVLAENITEDEEYAYIKLNFDNMLDADTEYNLVVKLSTDRHENIYYYTRIIMLADNYCKSQIDFANMFSDATFNSETSDSIISYLEPDSSEDNTNLGKVTIHSSYNQVTWGALAPEKVTDSVIKIKELLGDIGCYELNYKIKALNDYDTYEYYNVTEYFRIKWTSSEIYLLDYNRTMEQIFNPSSQGVSAVRINLGITSDSDCEFLASNSTKYIAFVKQNNLWLMDIRKNQMTALYAFRDIEGADVRDENSNNNIKIISLDDEGNTEFIVYGYMNRGEHEGMVGVSLYNYDSKKNIVEEKIFIPFTRQFGILEETMGKLCYINDDNIMYIMLNDSLYSIDLTGSEYVEVISDLSEDGYSINESGNIIAWEKNGDKAGSDSISMLNLETKEEKEITAAENTKLKVIGFVGDDFAYGIAGANDVVLDMSGNITVAMNKLKIINFEGETLKEYVKEGYYFVSAKIEDNMINLNRVTKAEDGRNFVNADEYQIFGNEEEENNVVSLGTITTDKKKKEQVINFVTKVTSANKFKKVNPNEIRFSETNSLSMRELISNEEKYYVYGSGKLLNVTDKISEAIIKAYENAGVVISESGSYVWARISKPVSNNITGVKANMLATEDINSKLSVCLSAILTYNGINKDVTDKVLNGSTAISILSEEIADKNTRDLTGCSLEQMLYFVSKGEPVLAMSDVNNYVVIVGYDFYNVILYNPVTGENYKQGQEEAGEMFEKAGNKFIVTY